MRFAISLQVSAALTCLCRHSATTAGRARFVVKTAFERNEKVSAATLTLFAGIFHAEIRAFGFIFACISFTFFEYF